MVYVLVTRFMHLTVYLYVCVVTFCCKSEAQAEKLNVYKHSVSFIFIDE